jgi:hypothetical protein
MSITIYLPESFVDASIFPVMVRVWVFRSKLAVDCSRPRDVIKNRLVRSEEPLKSKIE